MKESPIQKDIVNFLDWKKCIVMRINSGIVQDARSLAWLHLAPAGTPDLLVGLPKDGYHVIGHIETKRSAGGKLNDNQIRVLRGIHRRGTPWLVADSLADAERWFSDWGYHGAEKYIIPVIDEREKFVTAKPFRKNAKLTMSEFLRFNRHEDAR